MSNQNSAVFNVFMTTCSHGKPVHRCKPFVAPGRERACDAVSESSSAETAVG